MGTICSVSGTTTTDENIKVSREVAMEKQIKPGSPQIQSSKNDNEKKPGSPQIQSSKNDNEKKPGSPQIQNSKKDIHDGDEEKADMLNDEETSKIVKTDDKAKVTDDNDAQGDDTKEDDDDDDDDTTCAKKKKSKKLTPEEIADKKVEVLEKVIKHIENMKDKEWVDEDGKYVVGAKNLLICFYNSYFALKAAPLADRVESRRHIASEVLKTDILTKVCHVVIDIYPKGWANAEKKTDQAVWSPIRNALLYVHNYADASAEFGERVADVPGYLEMMKRILLESIEPYLKQDQPVNRFSVMKWALSTVHNVSMVESNLTRLKSLSFTQVLEPYLNSPDKMIQLNCLASLAGIIDEEESEMLNRNRDSVEFLMKVLRKGLPTKNRRYNGWSCKECGYAVKKLARNDANKKLLVEVGALELLVKLAEGNVEEQLEAVGALWALSFDRDNRKVMVENEDLGVIPLLLNLKSSDDVKVKAAANGTLWNLREDLKKSEEFHDLGATLSAGRQAKDTEKQGELVTEGRETLKHIMISYQWASQKLLIQVRDSLVSNGFKVWMDIDQMGGSTLQAMADAVEKASIVLMAMSQKYKDSPNCRAEAEYAFQQRKKIVPLMVERGYKPDGWLGFILGAKLFFDFSGKYVYEVKLNELLKELRRIKGEQEGVSKEAVIPKKVEPSYHQPKIVDEPDTHVPVKVTHSLYTIYSDVRKWTTDDIKNWVNKNDLPVNKFGKLTAGEIALLLKMGREAPESFYRCLQETLKITDLLTQSKLVWALEDIGK